MSRSTRLGLLVGGIVIVGLAVGLFFGVVLAGEGVVSASPGGPSTTAGPGQTTETTETTAVVTQGSPVEPTTGGDCEIPAGEPYTGGPTADLIDLGESNGVRVEGLVFPHPDYEGNPWTQWGQGVVLPDGRFISAIGDHIGPDGNSFVYEFDPASGRLAMIADVLSYVDHVPGTWGYGKIHGQMSFGPCGEVYYSTYWGTYRGIRFEGNYRGDLLFRLDPYGQTVEPLTVPVDLHGQASLASSPAHGLVYGEAIDPVKKDNGVDEGPFFAYDVATGESVFVGPPTPHVGFRAMIVDDSGKAYYSTGGGELAVYDPATGELGTHAQAIPGDWLRATTVPDADGRVFGVTEEPDVFFVMNPDGSIQELGEAPGYTTSLALAPDGSRFFYMPGAHGNAHESGAQLIAVDTDSGEQTVIVELNQLVEEHLGLTVGGTYNVATSPEGDKVYVGVNASPLGDDSGFGEVALLVVHLP
jgi:hypothetical protein